MKKLFEMHYSLNKNNCLQVPKIVRPPIKNNGSSLKKYMFERFFGNRTLHVCYPCSKDLQHGMLDGPLLTNGGCKSLWDFADSNVKKKQQWLAAQLTSRGA